jgi:polar amino acid transport system substrate-binding protein
MNRFRFVAIAIGLAALCLVTAAPDPALAGAARTVTVATDATWPPMEMVDASKKIVGFDVDYLTAVAKEAGFAISFKNTAWDGIFAGLAAGRYDMIASSVTITDERKKQYDFSDPYINVGQILVVPKTETGKTLAALKGKRAGAQIGTTGAMEIKKTDGVELKTCDEIGLAFEDIRLAGPSRRVVCDEPTAAHYALQRKEYKEKFKIVGETFTQESYGFVVKKGNTELVDLLNKGIKAAKAKGIDEQLRKKWLR